MLHYFFGFDEERCDRALLAADFDGLGVRRFWRTELAADAALGDVALAGALRCGNALLADDLDFEPGELERNVEDAARPADLLVTLAILASWLNVNRMRFSVVVRAYQYNVLCIAELNDAFWARYKASGIGSV